MVLQQLRVDFGQFRHLPQELVVYAENVIRQGNEKDHFVECLLAEDRLDFLKDLNGRFQRACNIANTSPRDLARTMGFNPADTMKGRLESLLAQVRAIFGLAYFGATSVTPLPSQGRTEADFVASFGHVKCAVEVFHRASWSHLYTGHVQKRYNPVDYFTNRASDKKRQLDSTASAHDCQKMLLLGVVDSNLLVALRTKTHLNLVLEQIAAALDWGPDYHFAIVTGKTSYEGVDDCIYPQLGVVKG